MYGIKQLLQKLLLRKKGKKKNREPRNLLEALPPPLPPPVSRALWRENSRDQQSAVDNKSLNLARKILSKWRTQTVHKTVRSLRNLVSQISQNFLISTIKGYFPTSTSFSGYHMEEVRVFMELSGAVSNISNSISGENSDSVSYI